MAAFLPAPGGCHPTHCLQSVCPRLSKMRSPVAPVLERAGGCQQHKPSQICGEPHGTVLCAGEQPRSWVLCP